MIPPKLRRWKETLYNAVDDMKDDFMLAVKKAIIDFVLRDPAFVQRLETEFDTGERRELAVISQNWGPSVKKAKNLMERNLHVINPCVVHLLDLWYREYR